MRFVKMLGNLLRVLVRFPLVWGIFIFAILDYVISRGKRWSIAERASWLSKWCRRMLRVLGFEVVAIGEKPKGGFIISNHLSYMDIIVMGSLIPQVFLAKSEVRGWPLVGKCARIAGTLFINRKKKSDVVEKGAQFERVIDAGVGMTVFLEGTSSDGSEVLPFKASLLQPVVANDWPVTPAYLKYECEDADPGLKVCWWGDMGFVSHLLSMLRVRRVRATIAFGPSRRSIEERKLLAQHLYDDVQELRSNVGITAQQPAG